MITAIKGKKQKIVIVSSPHLQSSYFNCLSSPNYFVPQQQHDTNRKLNKKSSVILLLSAMANFSLILGYCKLESQRYLKINGVTDIIN